MGSRRRGGGPSGFSRGSGGRSRAAAGARPYGAPQDLAVRAGRP